MKLLLSPPPSLLRSLHLYAGNVPRLVLNDSCIELCHGFVEAIHRLSLDGAMQHMDLGDTDSESNVSSLEASDTSSVCSDNDEWLQRVSNKYGGGYLQGPLPAPSPPINDSGRQYPTRVRASPVRFQPSPSGVAQDCVSPGEYFAAVVDPNLSDVSVTSTTETETESTSGSESGLNLSFGAALASIRVPCCSLPWTRVGG